MTFEGSSSECSVGLSRLRDGHLGRWSCKVLATARADGRPGSVVETAEFRVAEEEDGDDGDGRTGRLDATDVQGVERGDDGTIAARVEADDGETVVGIFWIVGR